MFIREIGLARAECKLVAANLSDSFDRLVFHIRRASQDQSVQPAAKAPNRAQIAFSPLSARRRRRLVGYDKAMNAVLDEAQDRIVDWHFLEARLAEMVDLSLVDLIKP